MMMTSSGVADGSWELTVSITDVEVEKTLRVRGDLHIGGLMLRLVEGLGQSAKLRLTVSFQSFLLLFFYDDHN